MWSASFEVADVYVGLRETGVAVGESLSWQGHDAIEAGLDDVFARLAGERRRRARVWLSGALARPFLCGPMQGLRHWREVESLAEAMAGEQTGIESPCIVQVEDWPSPAASLAAAMSQAVCATVHALAREHRIRMRSLRPWWAGVVDNIVAAEPTVRTVSVTDGDAMVVLRGDSGQWEAATSYVPALGPEQARQLFARQSFNEGTALEGMTTVRLQREATGTSQLPFAVLAGGPP